MILITDSERKALLERYPKALIVSTKHHAFLAGYDTAPHAQYLQRLRNVTPKNQRRSIERKPR